MQRQPLSANPGNRSADQALYRVRVRSNAHRARIFRRWMLPLLVVAMASGEWRANDPVRAPALTQTQDGPTPPAG